MSERERERGVVKVLMRRRGRKKKAEAAKASQEVLRDTEVED